MRALDPALAAHLESGVTTLCRCWRLTRRDGVVFGFTDHDRALTFEGVTFSAVDGLAATGDVTKAGLGVGGLEIEGAFSQDALTAEDLSAGLYDGATITLWLVNWADVAQRLVLREGTLGEVTRADGAFRAEVRGPMQSLETIRGRVVTITCDADLGDRRCKVDLAARTETATVVSVEGNRVGVTGIDEREPGYFARGVAFVKTGDAAGVRRPIVAHTTGADRRYLVLGEEIAALRENDTIDVTPGCDKRFATCRSKFSNLVNFQGFPHLPGNDKAFQYARSGG